MSTDDGTTRSESLGPDGARAFYPDTMTLREARERYFQRSGFTAATYTSTWITLPLGPLKLPLPNFSARKEAVRIHDLNHILTGYGTDWLGEFRASAFELGMGVGRYWAGWMINAGGAAGGLLRAPGEMLRAHARGRATARSTYALLSTWDEAFLDKPLAEVRALVGVVDDATPTARDAVAVVGHALWGAAVHLAPLVAFVVVLGLLFGLRQ